jgi:ABC-type transport system substrate-binding protein
VQSGLYRASGPCRAMCRHRFRRSSMNVIQSRRRFLGVLSAGAASAIAPAALAATLAPAADTPLTAPAPAVAMPSPRTLSTPPSSTNGMFTQNTAPTDEIQSRIGDEDPCPLKLRRGRPPSERSIAKRMARRDVQEWLVRYREAEAAHGKSCQQLFAARGAFLQTQPTTVAGLVAYLDHVEGPISTGDLAEAWWDETEKELAFPTLATAFRNIIERGRA